MVFVEVTRLSDASRISTTGCEGNAEPEAARLEGWVVKATFAAAPGFTVTEFEQAELKPVAVAFKKMELALVNLTAAKAAVPAVADKGFAVAVSAPGAGVEQPESEKAESWMEAVELTTFPLTSCVCTVGDAVKVVPAVTEAEG
jgi:hypothetical protein